KKVILNSMSNLTHPSGNHQANLLRRIYKQSFAQLINRIKDRNAGGDTALIRSSTLFNETWYLENNPDVAQKKMDPALHYVLHGGFEGRDPGPNFYGNGYLDLYPD